MSDVFNSSSPGAGSMLVGEGVLAKGTFKVPGRAVIQGTFEGELAAKELLVGPSGSATGKVEAETAEIRGAVRDTLVVSGLLLVRTAAKISGSVFYGEIEVEKGAELEGKIVRQNSSGAAGEQTGPAQVLRAVPRASGAGARDSG